MLVNDPSFYQQIKDSKKILVLDLGFLGDTIHLLPALWCIRQAMPDTELHVAVAEHVMSIMQVVPWVDKILGYPRFPKGPKWYQDWNRIKKLRAENYDAVININGSQRSVILTRATGALLRLGRIQPRPFFLRKFCLTHAVDVSFDTMPMYEQRWQCMKEVGFPGDIPEFHIELPTAATQKAEHIIGNIQSFIHISPFTTEDYKEIPPNILATFINRLNEEYPDTRIAVSCAPNQREQSKLIHLLSLLNFKPWKIFPGTLNLIELAAVVQRAKLHVGGDSGALHVALMTGVPTLSWFRDYASKVEWLPPGENHRHVIGTATPHGLEGLDSTQLWSYGHELLSLQTNTL